MNPRGSTIPNCREEGFAAFAAVDEPPALGGQVRGGVTELGPGHH